jgi:LuxR family maltose regulon positive regulatory protein
VTSPGFVAKILVPRRRPNTITRGRLLDVALGSGNGTLTVIRAPAGFGKTTVLVDVVNAATAQICWVSMDEWDQDPATFLQYLWLAVRRLDTAGNGRPRTHGDDPRQLLSQIAARIAEHEEDVWVVLDDFHYVDGSEQVIELVDYLARRIPPNCRLMIASRTRPPLPSLSRLQLIGNVTELTAADLAFTVDEIREFYDASQRRDVTHDEITRVVALTEGWPAGVALAGDPAALSASRPESPAALAEYLASEVFDRLPGDLRKFLLRTSVFDKIEAEGCEAVLQEGAMQRHLEALERHNVPVFRVEGAAVEYRVHPLFRDFLRARMMAEAPAEWRELSLRAGAWQASRGRVNEAIWLLAQGEDWNQIETLIEAEAPQAYKLGRWHLITSWLEQMPAQELRRRKRLRLWEAKILVRLGQADPALRVISEALDSTPASDLALLAEWETLRAWAVRSKGEIGSAVESCRRAVDLATRGNAPVDVVTEARKQLGSALAALGSLAEAERELRAVLAVHEIRGDIEESASVNGVLGTVLASMGSLEGAALHLEQARQQWKKVGNAKELSWVLNNLAVIYLSMGRRGLASELVVDSLAYARQSGHDKNEAYALATMGEVELRSNELALARQHFDEALSLAEDLGELTLATHILAGLALVHLGDGEVDKAELLARRALISADEREADLERGLANLALGRVFRRQGRLEEATDALGSAARCFETGGARKELGTALLYLADAALPLRKRRAVFKSAISRIEALIKEGGVSPLLAEAAREVPAPIEFALSRRFAGEGLGELLPKAASGETLGGPVEMGALPVVEVQALGTFEVRVGGRPVPNVHWTSERSKELFLFLLTNERPMARDEITAVIWPDKGGAPARSLFHSTLHRIRRALFHECLIETRRSYALNPAGTFVLDAREFLHLADRARELSRNREASTEVMRQAVRIYRGPFAPLLESEWAHEYRMKLDGRFGEIADTLSARLLEDGDYAGAVEVSEALLNSDPYSESAEHILMQAHAALGNAEAAMHAYRRFRDRLAIELAVEPGHKLQQLHQALQGREERAPQKAQ